MRHIGGPTGPPICRLVCTHLAIFSKEALRVVPIPEGERNGLNFLQVPVRTCDAFRFTEGCDAQETTAQHSQSR
jgi:hypothetical protein